MTRLDWHQGMMQVAGCVHSWPTHILNHVKMGWLNVYCLSQLTEMFHNWFTILLADNSAMITASQILKLQPWKALKGFLNSTACPLKTASFSTDQPTQSRPQHVTSQSKCTTVGFSVMGDREKYGYCTEEYFCHHLWSSRIPSQFDLNENSFLASKLMLKWHKGFGNLAHVCVLFCIF